ncbi:hypothetical protein SAMN02745163_03388 [Clostridium cavendishii DSM 21758]|uniref:Uncharacterized protein n=1 Tax=Clostridium cavendishii DSM 21758 TaxID=1121302 RepID=A0A1M6QFE8_9CLOT|nr:hypothetical protein [Clostridium cavendishii]SHK18989.1 hypothetical protein SAMN02745163_03388 [Clostridium cavendishii DSM 21758]
MSGNVNSWGVYPWFIEDGEELIAPSDLERFKNLSPYGKVFKCINEDGEYITLKYGEEIYQVKSRLYKQVNASIFSIGTEVRLAKKPEVTGIIVDINWHIKNSSLLYYISVGGKRKSKRYINDELIKI